METRVSAITDSNQPKANWTNFDGPETSGRNDESFVDEENPSHDVHDMKSQESPQPSNVMEVVATIEPSHSIQISRDHPLNLSTPSSVDVHNHEVNMSTSLSTPRVKSNGVPSPTNGVSRSQSTPSDHPVQVTSSSTSSRPKSLFSQESRPKNKRFKNGDIVVSLLPLNTSCAWITPATFRPQLVPEELMERSLTLTVEDYVQSMNILVNDYRFKVYAIAYKRVIFFWISLGFLLLMSLLFSGARGLTLFCGGLLWLIMNGLGIFICIWIKFKLYRQLENCVSDINETILMKHNLLIGVDDKGHLSCHKINLYFIYFDTNDCVSFLNQLLIEPVSQQSSNNATSALPPVDIRNIDINDGDVIITGPSSLFRSSFGNPNHGSVSSTTIQVQPESRNNQQQQTITTANNVQSRTVSLSSTKRTQKLIARYSQRWVKEYVRKRLDLNVPLHYEVTPSGKVLDPRHCANSRCLCQFIEEHLRFKPITKFTWRDLCL